MKNQGFVLLYAVLLVSIVLTISLSLYDITYRQLVLASTVEASQLSFYAADGVRDCIIYWDDSTVSGGNYFGYIGSDPIDLTPPPANFDPELDCASVTDIYDTSIYNDGASEYEFNYDGDKINVIVEVTKKLSPKTNEFTVTSNYGVGSLRQVQTIIKSVY